VTDTRDWVPNGKRVRLAVTLSHLDGWARPRQADLLDLARTADRAGVDQIVLSEHVVLAQVVTGHPGARPGAPTNSGGFPFPSDEEYPEPLVALSAIAAVTERARLSTNILIAPLRPAVLLAKMAATVDVLSGGRLDLGVGRGWHEEEFSALGVPAAESRRRMEEAVAACRVLWAGGPSSYSSASVSFTDIYCSPTPVQPRLPVWFAGGPGDATARVVAEMGDGWTCIGGTPPEEVRRGRELISRAAEQRDRDPAEITVRASLPGRTAAPGRADLGATLASAEELVGAGADIVQLPPLSHFVAHPDEVGDLLGEAVAAVAALSGPSPRAGRNAAASAPAQR
jgi:probable F420-dependent oxidoreductase